MEQGRNSGDMLNNVKCEVHNCTYYGTGDTCHAQDIKVANENAHTEGETFCSTYISK